MSDISLPKYTLGEEIANAVTHGLGAVFGALALALCLLASQDPWDAAGAAVYGGSMVLLYAVSCVYHALGRNGGKRVLRVLDHCSIYLLIAGTYTPILLCGLRPAYPGWAWSIFGLVWGAAVMGATLSAVDLKKFSKLSMVCYIAMGWCIVLAVYPAVKALPAGALLWILAGGIAYTVGAVFYGLGKKRRYIHSVFHLFVLLGSILQFAGVYDILRG